MEQGLGQPERTEEEKEFLRATGMNPVYFDMARCDTVSVYEPCASGVRYRPLWQYWSSNPP